LHNGKWRDEKIKSGRPSNEKFQKQDSFEILFLDINKEKYYLPEE
jgi:hypothetical protein